MEYHNVSTPYETSNILGAIDGHIVPANWAYLDGELTSYEYRFTTASEMEGENMPDLPCAFVEELYVLLRNYGLESRYGIALLPEEAHDASKPPRLEFTAGRANVTVPYTSSIEGNLAMKAIYLFSCVDPLLDGE